MLLVLALLPATAAARGGPEDNQARYIVGLPVEPAAIGSAGALKDAAAVRSAADPLRMTAGVELVEILEGLPYAIIDASPQTVAALQVRGEITSVEPDLLVTPSLDGALALSGAPSIWTAGPTAADEVVAVIDTGVLGTHPALAGKLVGEACFVSPGSGGGPGCPNGASSQVGPGAAAPCSRPDCLHGTYVAIAAAGDGGADATGVARGASVYAVRVFDFTGPGCEAGCARYSDVLAALRHLAVGLPDSVHLAAINLSLQIGDGRFTSACDDQYPALRSMAAWFAALGSGVPLVASSGNLDLDVVPPRTSGMAVPACVDQVVSVGATASSRSVASFSQFSRGLDLLAPGVGLDVRTSDAGVLGPTTRLSGTTLSAAQVSGAFALTSELLPGAPLVERVRFLRVTGIPVADTRPRGPDLVRPRLRIRLPVAWAARRIVPGGAPVSGSGLTGDFDGDGRDDLLDTTSPFRVAYGRVDDAFDLETLSQPPTSRGLVGNFVGSPGGPDDVYWMAASGQVEALWMGRTTRTVRMIAQRRAIDRAPAVGDFDGDGLDDIIWFENGATPGAVWTGGATGFTKRRSDLIGGRALVGDVDADGADDLLVYRAPGVVELRPGSSDLSFEGFASGLDDLPAALADLDGDGDLDAILAGSPMRTQRFAAGTYEAPIEVDAAIVGSVLARADVDGNGIDEVVAGRSRSGSVFDSTGLTTVSSDVLTNGAASPVAADFDGDGHEEILWRAPGAGAEIWWSWEG